MSHPILLAVPLALFEMVTFYLWHWPHRELLPERFRGFLLAKGLLKGLTLVGLTLLFYRISPTLGWLYPVLHLVVGLVVHVRFCRQHGVDPIRAEPRERYVLATTEWVERLEAAERQRSEKK